MNRLSFRYLETNSNTANTLLKKGIQNAMQRRFKRRNPFTLRIYRDEDQFE